MTRKTLHEIKARREPRAALAKELFIRGCALKGSDKIPTHKIADRCLELADVFLRGEEAYYLDEVEKAGRGDA